MEKAEEAWGAVMTYGASVANAGIGVWLGENWFLVLSAIAVLIRIGIDVPRLLEAWKRKIKN